VQELLSDPELRHAFGRWGKARVRERFLLPRLIADELRLYASVLRAEGSDSVGPPGSDAPRFDPVCGIPILDAHGRHLALGGNDYYFCSEGCEQQFAAAPDLFLRAI
jgi:trehalose synthase